ncbi:efflux RND transporter periplasmic adaptor subunit [soil metagenome]
MTQKKKVAIGVGGAVLVLALAGIAVASSGDKGVEVRMEPVTRRDLVSTVTASGRIDPQRKVDISADISGRVIDLAVQEGQTVNRGDLLLRIDPTTAEAQVRRAQAAVAQAQASAAQVRSSLLQAQADAQRSEQLAKSEDDLIAPAELEQVRTAVATTRAQYEAARFGVSQAQAALSESRDALSKTTIYAPMAGRVTRLNIDEGETVVVGTMNNPGSLLLTIADLAVMEAVVEVDETDVPAISIGDSAIVRIDAFPDREFAGRVARIANSSLQNPSAASGVQAAGSAAAQSVDFEVGITLTNPPPNLRPDLSATADIVTAKRAEVLAIPLISLTVRDSTGAKLDAGSDDEEDGGADAPPTRTIPEVEGVFRVRGGKAEFTPVEVGITGDSYFEVLRGLQPGDTVVSGTYQAIRELEEGEQVRSEEKDGGEKAKR